MIPELMSDEDLTQFLLAGTPEPSDADLLEVRRRVMARLRPRVWRWAVASIAAAAAVLLLSVYGTKTTAPKPSVVPVVARTTNSVRVDLPVVQHMRHARRTPQGGIRSVDLIAQKDGPPLIKITTQDPNVVILLAGNTNPDSEPRSTSEPEQSSGEENR